MNGDYYSKTRSNRSKLRISMILCTLTDRSAALRLTYHAVLYGKQIGRTDCICLHSMSLYIQCTATTLIDTNKTKASFPAHILASESASFAHMRSQLYSCIVQ